MQKIKLLMLLLLSAVMSFSTSAAQISTEEPEFIQWLDQPGHKALQVSVVRYQFRTGGDDRYVDLVGAVHVGDKQYYQALNKMFKDYDVVLYELVAPEGTKIPKGGMDNEEKSWISAIQIGMKNVLGLSFQMEEVDYTPNHFVHADFTPQEFSQSMKNKGESFFSMFFKLWRASVSQQLTGQSSASDFDMMMALISSDRENALKEIMAKELASTDGMFKVLEGPEGSTLVAARNQKALKVLREQMKNTENQSFAIFYGAAHLPDFHERLVRDFDMVPVSEQWLDAWKIK
ncbi:MAG: hypothetical protein KDI92_00505 [Xanthomonadales bacterium]|nr:hypothetical protein [Xanthomonadales bacterium]